MKIKYKLDKTGAFTITKDRNILRPLGYFSLDQDNHLVYRVTESAVWRKKYDLPEKIVLCGNWNLDENHELKFTLYKTETQTGKETLHLKSELVEAKSDALIFSLGTSGKARTHSLRLMQLKGRWQADKHNRLQFLVKKTRLTSDTITFQGAWQVRKNILVYTYKKEGLKTKSSKVYTLYFKGFWQINQRNRITYVLNAENNSCFEFKAFLQTPSLIGKSGTIKYRVGIGIKKKAEYKPEIITLYGAWKLQRKAGLSFNMDYDSRKAKPLYFNAFVSLDKKSKVVFTLSSVQGKPLGLSLEFHRTYFKGQAEWFLRALDKGGEQKIEGGVQIRF